MSAELVTARVVVCDDNDVERMLLDVAATGAGVGMVSTSDRSELLDALVVAATAGTPFHVVLCDLNMPGLTLPDFLSALAADDTISDTPVVIWSEEIAPRRAAELSELGVDRIETKRASVTDLEAFLSSLARDFAPDATS